MGAKIKVNPGDKYNMLTVIKEVDKFVQPSGQTQRGFLCKCDCGESIKVRLSHLRHDRVKSCGCLQGEQHGDSGNPLHTIWRGMRNRVREHYPESHLYYERGIYVCDEWDNSYLEFKEWAENNGYEEGLTIDRVDNNGSYTPDNCRFVPQYINNENRRITKKVKYNGKRQPLTKILRDKGIKDDYKTISARIRMGWEPERAIDEPIREGDYK